MFSNKMIALFLVTGITFGAASTASPRQDEPPSSVKAKVSQPAAAARAISASPKAPSKPATGSRNITKTLPLAGIKQSSQSLTIRKAPSSPLNSKREDAQDTETASTSIKSGRPLEGRIERKKPSGLKELLKDEFDGPIHPVSTNNKNF